MCSLTKRRSCLDLHNVEQPPVPIGDLAAVAGMWQPIWSTYHQSFDATERYSVRPTIARVVARYVGETLGNERGRRRAGFTADGCATSPALFDAEGGSARYRRASARPPVCGCALASRSPMLERLAGSNCSLLARLHHSNPWGACARSTSLKRGAMATS
jgi:hypothetical protein